MRRRRGARLAVLLATVSLVPFASVHAVASHTPVHYDLIIPGEGIGDARLGISATELDAVNVRAACKVTGSFVDARATKLATNFGGGCTTRGGTQVGMGLNTIVTEFGRPDTIRPDGTYPHAVAVWQEYMALGIGFRVLVFPDRSTLIQAISVFPATAGR